MCEELDLTGLDEAELDRVIVPLQFLVLTL